MKDLPRISGINFLEIILEHIDASTDPEWPVRVIQNTAITRHEQ